MCRYSAWEVAEALYSERLLLQALIVCVQPLKLASEARLQACLHKETTTDCSGLKLVFEDAHSASDWPSYTSCSLFSVAIHGH